MDGKKIVRDGYDQVAAAHLETRKLHSPDLGLLEHLTSRLPANASILDVRCGAGHPITSRLAERFRVAGIDFSLVQLRLAHVLVPAARLVCQDLTTLGFAARSFDAICSFYAIIHAPRDLHLGIFSAFYELLVPGGLVLLCLGSEDLRGDIERDYFGSQMFWSHFDEVTNRRS